MSPAGALADILRRGLAAHPHGRLCVAFSGGPDSAALLHALAALPEARERALRALHVDHGLHEHSAHWAAHCERFCQALDIPCRVLRVHVARDQGRGIEAAAREARYAALAGALHSGEGLLLGHHRDDQAETVLLKLLRGAGPEGLGGMRASRPLGKGWLWRPLLTVPRAQLRAYAQSRELACVQDPSNADVRLSRNYLRQEILPRLAAHWPQAVDSILHSAALSRSAADGLKIEWLKAFEALLDPASGSLDARGWTALPAAWREPLLDHWLHARGFGAPTAAQRRQIERQLHAGASRLPCIRWPGVELHVWKQRLWALPPQPPIDACWQVRWQGEPIALPDGGQLRLRQDGARLPQALTVRLRRGGERIRPAGDRHTRELRDLFQQSLMPPWRRGACPLIHLDGELIAVADRWLSASGAQLFASAGSLPLWTAGR